MNLHSPFECIEIKSGLCHYVIQVDRWKEKKRYTLEYSLIYHSLNSSSNQFEKTLHLSLLQFQQTFKLKWSSRICSRAIPSPSPRVLFPSLALPLNNLHKNVLYIFDFASNRRQRESNSHRVLLNRKWIICLLTSQDLMLQHWICCSIEIASSDHNEVLNYCNYLFGKMEINSDSNEMYMWLECIYEMFFFFFRAGAFINSPPPLPQWLNAKKDRARALYSNENE